VSSAEALPYRSPISKLLRFFCRSRDKWKAKCKEAKRENRSLKYRLAVMTESRNRWKAEVRQMRESLQAEAVTGASRGDEAQQVQHLLNGDLRADPFEVDSRHNPRRRAESADVGSGLNREEAQVITALI